MASTRPKYSYTPLPSPTHIRLVEFLPPARPGLITFTLLTVPLDSAPAYNGFSYCWGSRPEQAVVLCNGQRMHVSQNLRDGMLRLSSGSTSQLERAGARYWIDQICINQDDLEEKMGQVQLMSRIFSRARETVIWLGEFTERVGGRNVAFLKRLERACFDDTSGSLGYRGKSYGLDDRKAATSEDLMRWGLPHTSSSKWNLLIEFTRIAWFNRIWTIQETVLAPACRNMIFGEVIIPFDWYARLLEWLDHRYMASSIGQAIISPTIEAFLIFKRQYRWSYRCSVQMWQLGALLGRTVYSRSTDPRDQVYALLSCIGHGRSASNYIMENNLVPDYRKSVPELYRVVTRLCIEEAKTLQILVRGGVPDQCEDSCQAYHGDFPSWVQRLDVPPFTVSDQGSLKLRKALEAVAECSDTRKVSSVYNVRFSACDYLQAELRPSSDAMILSLKGIYLGKISKCSTVFSLMGPMRSYWVAQAWELALRWAGLDHDCSQIDADDLAQRLSLVAWPAQGGSESEIGKATGFEARRFWIQLAESYKQICQQGATSLSRKALDRYEKLGRSANLSLYQETDGASARVVLISHIRGRRLFTTDQGLLGFGSAYLQEGDELWVFFGGVNPHVLSRCGDEHHDRGEAFIREFANGEAVHDWRAGKREAQWVDLR